MKEQQRALERRLPTAIAIAYGDGIGPEIMRATLAILEAGGAELDPQEIKIGEKVYQGGNSSGIGNEAWDILMKTRVFLKAPITTPQGGGVKSLNVTIRKALGLYANVRPCVSYYPYVATNHPKMDLVIIRENEEDLYAGIEYRQTNDVFQGVKLLSRPGTERIVRYAFEYAVAHERKRVTCITKDNIMKITDGMFHRVFNEIALEYPEIESDHLIVDIGAARVADTPEMFEVIVTLNLYGDIISDIAAQVAGSVGLAGSANIGQQCSMFEAIHGSAPTIAGMNTANPSGLLLGAIMMLVHIDQLGAAGRIHNAWLCTLEDGIHTHDIFKEGLSKKEVGTKEFAEAVIARLGSTPRKFATIKYLPRTDATSRPVSAEPRNPKKQMVGVDVFIDDPRASPNSIGAGLNALNDQALAVQVISNRGIKVWPDGNPETFCADNWRCRFVRKNESRAITHEDITRLLNRISTAGFDFIQVEALCEFDGEPGFSLSQGE